MVLLRLTLVGAGAGKQNRVEERPRKNFVPDRIYGISSMDLKKPQKSQKYFSVLRTEMAWPDETRHQFCTVPELAETEILNPTQEA